MKKNNKVIVLKEDIKVGNLLFEAGDAFVKTSNGWMIVEAEGDAEDEKEDDKEDKMEEEDEGDKDSDEDDKEDDKKEESKKRK